MKRSLAAALALALGLAPLSAQPARAQETDQLLGLILGIGALYAVGRALSERGDTTEAPPAPQVQSFRPRAPAMQGRQGHVPRTEDRFRKSVPAECFRRFDTRHGTVRGFPRRCVERTMRHAHKLPGKCLVNVRTERGPRSLYRAGCLRERGWRMDGRPGGYAGG